MRGEVVGLLPRILESVRRDDARVPVRHKDDVRVVVVGGEANAMMKGWMMDGGSIASVEKWR